MTNAERSTAPAKFWQNYTCFITHPSEILPYSIDKQSAEAEYSDNPSLLESAEALLTDIRQWAAALGFQQLGVTDVDLEEHEGYLRKWLDAGYHGTMDYMAKHGNKRSRPRELVPGTCRVISVRMDYLADDTQPLRVLESPEKAYVSRYALGRDYHKLIRKRLATLAKQIEARAGGGRYRAFVDSAPVLERAVAERAGLGWIAKNTMLINSDAGSWRSTPTCRCRRMPPRTASTAAPALPAWRSVPPTPSPAPSSSMPGAASPT